MLKNPEFTHPTLKRVIIREEGRDTTVENKNIKEPVIGWFRNVYNMCQGWSIHELDKFDTEWLEGAGINLKGVFRTGTDVSTSIAKFNLKTGTYAFIDNDHYRETNKVRFERMRPYNELFLDEESSTEKFEFSNKMLKLLAL